MASTKAKKIDSNSRDSAQSGSCVVPDCAPMEARLNAATLSDPNSLRPQVTISDRDIQSFPVLVDSGSTHCFVDPSFANMNSLSRYSVSLIVLCLFDGTTTTVITEATDLPICFPSGDVTPLDSDCKIVLGHNWLTQYNLSIDWVLSSIKFGTPTQQVPTLSSLPDPVVHSPSALRLNVTSVSSPSPTDSPQAPSLWAPPIALINAAAFLKACQLNGSQQFSIQLKPDGSFRTASVDAAPDLSSVPKAYHDFADVFSKAKASVLMPHREYDLKIELKKERHYHPVDSTHSPLSNSKPFGDSSTKTSALVSSVQPHPPMQPLSSS